MQLADFIQAIIRDHARYSWSEDARDLLNQLQISYVKASDAGKVKTGLCIPVDISFDLFSTANSFSCFGCDIHGLSPLSIDHFPDYKKTDDYDWLWKNNHGAVMLPFNLAGYIDHFMYQNKEWLNLNRDGHGRLAYQSSTLKQLGLESIPILNQYLYAVLSVAKGIANHKSAADPASHILPPVLVLSHDCDQLRGNDLFTQAIRIYRLLLPIFRFKLPALSNFKFVVQNFLYPRIFYFDDALAMQDIEFQFGFRSAFYFLTGIGGRFGARSGSPIVGQFAKKIRNSFEIGVHYNYRYALDPAKLKSQIDEVSRITGREIISGRAHYLIFNPVKSPKILSQCGIQVDESVGFVEENSFRLGFAGAFRTWSGLPDGSPPIVEIPLSFMDRNTLPNNKVNNFYKMLAEVEKVGGLISLVFHPGCFNNPELPELRGQYLRHLNYFHEKNYRCMLPSEVGALISPATN